MKHKTNSFSSLGQETTDSELKNDKELRNTNKKLKKKRQKYEHNPSDDLLREINTLETLIREYEGSRQNPQKQKTSPKNKEKNSSPDDDDFLEKEYQKYKGFNEKRYKQQKEDEEKEKKENKEREERTKQERQKRKWRQHQENYYESSEDEKTIPSILENHDMDIRNLPEDITPLLNNYDHKLYKKLCLKYHPDKYENDSYSKLINCLKDFYQ